MPPTTYTVLTRGPDIVVEIERRKSRFLTLMRRADDGDAAQTLVDELRGVHHTARHHCSAWAIGADRRIQRANDDGEPSGTAGAPMLEALMRTSMPSGLADLSDVVVVVVRWFGGTLLGAGGLVSAYSDSVTQALVQARELGAFTTRQRMRQYRLSAPIAQAGRWENELRGTAVIVLEHDYSLVPGSAILTLGIPDDEGYIGKLFSAVAALSAGTAELEGLGTTWVDL